MDIASGLQTTNQSDLETGKRKLKVTHLGQFHYTKNQKQQMEVLAFKSQIKVISWLRQNLTQGDTAVLVEGLSQIWKPKDHARIPTAIWAAFPTGLPEDLSKLTNMQQKLIYRMGGAQTLYLLGEIDTLYPTISKNANKVINARIARIRKKYGDEMTACLALNDKEVNSLILEQREDAVKKILGNLDQKYKQAVVVYGVRHNFENNFKGTGIDLKYINLTGCEISRKPLNLKNRKEAMSVCSCLEVPKVDSKTSKSLKPTW